MPNCAKRLIHVFLCLRVRGVIKSPQKYLKQAFLPFFDSWLPSISNRSQLKTFSVVVLIWLTLRVRIPVQNVWRNNGNFAVLVFCAAVNNAQKMKDSIEDFFGKCDQIRFGHIYWRNPQWNPSFFVQCNYTFRCKNRYWFH